MAGRIAIIFIFITLLSSGCSGNKCKDGEDSVLDVGPSTFQMDWADGYQSKLVTNVVASVQLYIPDAETWIANTGCDFVFESSEEDWLLLIPQETAWDRVENPEEGIDWVELCESIYQDVEAGRLSMDFGRLEATSDEWGNVPVFVYLRCPPLDCGGTVRDSCEVEAAISDGADPAEYEECQYGEGIVTVTFGSQTSVVSFGP